MESFWEMVGAGEKRETSDEGTGGLAGGWTRCWVSESLSARSWRQVVRPVFRPGGKGGESACLGRALAPVWDSASADADAKTVADLDCWERRSSRGWTYARVSISFRTPQQCLHTRT